MFCFYCSPHTPLQKRGGDYYLEFLEKEPRDAAQATGAYLLRRGETKRDANRCIPVLRVTGEGSATHAGNRAPSHIFNGKLK